MSPSPTATASIPPPLCVTTWSMAAPSLDANQVERRKRSSPPSAKVTPGTPCMRRVASISSATFSSSGTRKGSSLTSPRQEATTGSTGLSSTGSPGSRCAAFAIATASSAVRTTSASSRREVAAKPHRPPTSTRTPTPMDGAVDPLHLLVADGEGLALVDAGARIGVVGARLPGGLDGHPRDVQHPCALLGPTTTDRTGPSTRGMVPGAGKRPG